MEWFRDAKYGLFIHWGLYSIPAGTWQGKRSPGLGEWIMNRSQVPVRDYEKLAAQFNRSLTSCWSICSPSRSGRMRAAAPAASTRLHTRTRP